MSNKVVLEVTTKSDVQKLSTDLRTVSKDAAGVGKSVGDLSTKMDQTTKSATSFGSKLKSFGSTFQNTISQGSTFAFTLVNLQRQYRDLGDAQIAVDRSNLKVSKSQEALNKAMLKVKQLARDGKQGTDEYNQALLDEKQAHEQLNVAVQNAGEAQERFNDTQQNFWVGLVPTISSAGGTLMSMFQDLGGSKGISGLTDKIKGLGGATGGIASKFGSLATSLGGFAIGAGGALALAEIGAKAQEILDRLSNVKPGERGSILEGVFGDQATINANVKNIEKFNELEKNGLTGFQLLSDAVFGTHFADRVAKTIDKMKTDWGGLWDYSAWAATGKGGIIEGQIVKIENALTHLASTGKASMTQWIEPIAKLTPQTDPFGMIVKSLPTVNAGLSQMAKHAQDIGQLGLQLNNVINPVTRLDAVTTAANTKLLAFVTSTNQANAANQAYHDALMKLINSKQAELADNALTIPQLEELYRLYIKDANAARKYAASLDQAAEAQNRLNVNVAGYGYHQNKKGQFVPNNIVNGPRYVTFVNHKIVGSGPGVAPPTHSGGNFTPYTPPKKKKHRKGKQGGYHDYVDSPTWMLMGENGREEVDINPPGKSGRGGGGSGDIYVGPIYIGEDQVAGIQRRSMNKFQGVFK